RAPGISPQWASEVWNGHQGAAMRPSGQRRFRRPQDRIRWSEWWSGAGSNRRPSAFQGAYHPGSSHLQDKESAQLTCIDEGQWAYMLILAIVPPCTEECPWP